MPQALVEQPILESGVFDELSTRETPGQCRGPRISEFIETSLPRLFEEQVAKAGERVAVTSAGESLTYQELNAQANQLARHLRARGVGRESLVGICVDRSLDMAVGILGILKSGGAYLPLDPDYPAERLAFMLNDARPCVVVTKSNLKKSLPSKFYSPLPLGEGPGVRACDATTSQHDPSSRGEDTALPSVLLDQDWPEISRNSGANLSNVSLPNDLAYVIYTSGSTGEPKGAMIEHGNLANYLRALNHELGISRDDKYLHTASIAFSSSRRQLMLPLLQGATVVIATSDERKDPLALFQLIKECGVTVMDAVPSFWRTCTTTLEALTEESRSDLLDNQLRLMLSASEPLLSDIPRTWMTGFRHPAHHVHMFGQTETAGIVSLYHIPFAIDDDLNGLPIGRPIANSDIYILDSQQRPCPVGVAGELYIGGAGVGRGYLNRPELTAEKFIPHPLAETGYRLYRTGDWARYRADGQIEFAGRRDQPVKLRGFRVELGEIETALAKHPSIRESVVVARQDARAGTRLIAYFVSDGPADLTLSAGELRSFLSARLPEYEIPSVFVRMDALPLSANGKVDRLALPEPDDLRSGLSTEFVAPQNEIEELLAAIWSQVLRVERVGRDDNFFELGGHSLLAAQIVSRVCQEFKIQMALRILFEAPTLAQMAEKVVAALAMEQPAPLPQLQPVERGKKIPLSFAQQRLWFMNQLEPGSASYNIRRAFGIRGALDVGKLQRAVDEIVRRHEILRTNFVSDDGQPVQVISPSMRLPVEVTDLSGLATGEREIEVRHLTVAEGQKAFDLTSDPLCRIRLVKLAGDDYLLLLTIHHIISDGWSIGVLLNEVTAVYQSFSMDQNPKVPELEIQYADFALWQRSWLQGEMMEKQLAYWREKLREAPAALDLPTDYPRPAVQNFRGTQQSVLLSKELSDTIQRFSQQEGVTLFMTLLAAFQTLLFRYSGQDDIVVGSPIAGRTMVETEGLIGFFVNTLILRADLSDNPSFRELLRRTREAALGAYAHQDVPFEKLVEELRPQRSLDRTPLFQVMFALQNTPMPQFRMDGLELTPVELNSTTAKFDLSLFVFETADGLRLRLEYNTDLFGPATIERMLGHFQNLLSAIVALPAQPVAELSLTLEAERHQLLVEWNDTEADYPDDQSIHQLFEEQAARSPNETALIFANEQITYSELNARANQLARQPRRCGVADEDRVAICVERSIDMIVGLLGILKAGGTYVAIEPNYPAERTAFILADSQAKLLLTHRDIVEALPPSDAQILCFETIGERKTSESEENVGGLFTPESAAHVIYTSGSTGRPKGVVLSHRALVNRFAWMWRQYPFAAGEVCCQKTSLTFADSTWEIFGPLLQGVPLVIFPDDAVKDLPRFVEAMSANSVTRLVLVPSLLRAILESDDDLVKGLSDLQYCVCSGEALPTDLASGFREKLPHARLINLYGSSEVAADVTCYEVESTAGLSNIPVGRPIANTQVYILDASFEPAAVGVPGEIFVGGAGLARGYLNQPELTAEKFIPDPFSRNQSARLFRTGDLGRRLPDGNIEYRGRRDHQVKVRGFRIELREIEAALAMHPQVTQAVVTAREDERKDKRLVAYLIALGQPPAIAELRSHLLAKLPEQMVPSAFVMLDSLPLTASGKVNRLALPEPDYNAQIQESYVAPRTPTEELLSGIWAEVLKVAGVGVNDNFFELGGHSLLATQILSRTLKTFGVQLPLRALFEAPTVADMARRIGALREGADASATLPITVMPRKGPVQLSFGQQSFWFLDGLTPNTSAYNIFRVVRLGGQLDLAALQKALDELIARHEALRAIFPSVDGEPVQVIVEDRKLSLTEIALDRLPASAREPQLCELMKNEAHRPFDLGCGPLVRAVLFRLDAQQHVLLLSLHHIVADDWSMGLLSRDLEELYNAFATGRPPHLPELPIQYPDFSNWQHDCLQNGLLDSQLKYWKGQLTGAPALLELPVDRPRPVEPTFRGAHHTLTLPPALRDELVNLSQREGVTLFMTMLAAFQTLLARHSGQDDIVVGTPIAGRNRIETENLIGYFVNTLVLRTSLAGNPRFSELLRRVREVALGAYAHQEMPFGRLVKELQPARTLGHMPLFQVMFVFQNAPPFNLNLKDLSVSRERLFNESSPLDLTLEARETAEGIRCVFEYKTDLFDATTIARLAARFQLLLERISADPAQRIADLSLLEDAERHQLLVEWNDNRIDVANDVCIHQLFEAQADRNPDSIAAEFKGEEFTYRELNRRANQLAHFLRSRGVGPDTLVGICVHRSFEMLVGMLGVLKAGGAYVPLDPANPADRLAFMIEDAGLSLVLTQERLTGDIPVGGATVLCLDRDWDAIAAESDANPALNVGSTNLAYVIYTSGSTGNPKGVMIEHRSLVNFTVTAAAAYEIRPGDRVLQFASLSFDLSVEEIYPALIHGATIVLRTDDMISSARDFMHYCKQWQVTILDLPTAYWHELTDALNDVDLRLPETVRLVIIGGEKAAFDRVVAWHKLVGKGVRLVNTYGPTETTVAVTMCDLGPEAQSLRLNTVPIGRPLPNATAYLLDESLRPVPIGAPGELYIGGPGVARGYVKRPDLTAEKFIKNPFSSNPEARLYKTGDLVRYRPNGNIEFLGRIDNQIKIRGFRVELEEIEQALRTQPGVADCVVALHEDSEGDKRLFAYVVPIAGWELTISDLRNYLKTKLPSYMMPAAFELIDALPLLPSGKINRRALPAPRFTRTDGEDSFVAPRTPFERLLAVEWCEVLKLKRIGIHDNFFELGGHSLLAAKVVSRVRGSLEVNFGMVDLFQAPTIASLAALLFPRGAAHEPEDELAALLGELASLTDEEAQRRFDHEIRTSEAAIA